MVILYRISPPPRFQCSYFQRARLLVECCLSLREIVGKMLSLLEIVRVEGCLNERLLVEYCLSLREIECCLSLREIVGRMLFVSTGRAFSTHTNRSDLTVGFGANVN